MLRPLDVLVLTKLLGSGVIITALKREQADPAHVAQAIDVMSALNRAASRCPREAGAHAATDITGFGLIGHALEMADQSGVAFRFDWPALPFMAGAFDYAAQWIFAGGAETNERIACCVLRVAYSVNRSIVNRSIAQSSIAQSLNRSIAQ